MGRRDGWLCGRAFVGKILDDGTHSSEKEYHPTHRTPAFGCTRCDRAMCGQCYHYYENNIRSIYNFKY